MREKVEQRAHQRCEYCQAPQEIADWPTIVAADGRRRAHFPSESAPESKISPPPAVGGYGCNRSLHQRLHFYLNCTKRASEKWPITIAAAHPKLRRPNPSFET